MNRRSAAIAVAMVLLFALGTIAGIFLAGGISVGSKGSTSTTGSSKLLGESPAPLYNIPLGPSTPGCYVHGPSGWTNVTCLSPQTVLGFHHNPGTYLGPTSKSPGGGKPPTLIRGGLLNVELKDYAGETDSKWGDGAYSVQLNTNFFPGNNGQSDWVQFVYQDDCGTVDSFCAQRSPMCIWNVDVTTQSYNPTCFTPDTTSLSDGNPYYSDYVWFALIIGFILPNGNLAMYAGINGHGGAAEIVAPDTYGLASQWTSASGGIMGEGAGSTANFSGVKEQTDISIIPAVCPNYPQSGNLLSTFWTDCGGAPISTSVGSSSVTAESNNLVQGNPVLTSYFGGTHQWLSSVSNLCSAAYRQSYACKQFVNYGDLFGECYDSQVSDPSLYTGCQMRYRLDVNSPNGTANAGFSTEYSTAVVTSLDGTQPGPITMNITGLQQGVVKLGTSELSGGTCTFNYPVQPGTACNFPFAITTQTTAAPGIYPLNIYAIPPNGTIAFTNDANYTLTIDPSIAPVPVMVSPVDGSSVNPGTFTLVGYARSTDNAQLAGWMPCSRMQFRVTFSDSSVASATPTPDQSYQQTGYCDAVIDFSVLGNAKVSLSATNLAGVVGTSFATVSVGQQAKFTFVLSASPSSAAVVAGGAPVSFSVSVIATGGTPQPVTLNVTSLPSGATYSFTSNSVTPTASVTLTISAPSNTATGTFTVTISGIGGGFFTSTTIQLYVETIG